MSMIEFDEVTMMMFKVGWRGALFAAGWANLILIFPYAMLGGAPKKSAQTSSFIGIFLAIPVTLIGGIYGFFTGNPHILGIGVIIHAVALLTCEC
jgi:hypothetical protein